MSSAVLSSVAQVLSSSSALVLLSSSSVTLVSSSSAITTADSLHALWVADTVAWEPQWVACAGRIHSISTISTGTACIMAINDSVTFSGNLTGASGLDLRGATLLFTEPDYQGDNWASSLIDSSTHCVHYNPAWPMLICSGASTDAWGCNILPKGHSCLSDGVYANKN
jgi:hypothetical protein